MTNKEAIAYFKRHIHLYCVKGICREAEEMAIKALEQEPILDKIRAEIEALIEWHDCPIEYDNGNDAWYREACNQALKIIDKYRTESED